MGTEQFYRSLYGLVSITLGATFKAYIIRIFQLLQRTESFYIIIQFTVLTWHDTTATASHMNVLQIFLACRKESRIIVGIFLHVPEVAHTLHAFAVGVAADGCCIANEAEVEALSAVQRLKNNGGAAFLGIFAKLEQLFAKILSGLDCVRLAGLLSVEGRNHDYARRTDGSGCGDNLAHRVVKSSLHFGILSQNEAVAVFTGLVVQCQDEKSQLKNFDKALAELRTRLYNMEYEKYLAEISAKRKTMVAGGDRSAKIRTYNYPQSRVTDHRINYTMYNLPVFMDGAIQDVIDQLQIAENAERLKSEE